MNTKTISIGNKVIGVNQLCSASTAALITNLSERTIRDKAVNREFPIYKISSNCTKYLVQDLLDWLETKRVEPEQFSKAA